MRRGRAVRPLSSAVGHSVYSNIDDIYHTGNSIFEADRGKDVVYFSG